MNRNQKIALLATAVMLMLILLFPPFHCRVNNEMVNCGFSLISYPPKPPIKGFYFRFVSNINTGVWIIEYVITVTIGAIFWLYFRD